MLTSGLTKGSLHLLPGYDIVIYNIFYYDIKYNIKYSTTQFDVLVDPLHF